MYKHSPIVISMLCPVRPESKFFAHFIAGFLNKTKNFYDTELLVMPAKQNEWNQDLIEYLQRKEPSIKFIDEPESELGQRGHHIYINELAKHAKGDWILNFCEDMHILLRDWDEVLREWIREKQLDPDKCYMIIPRFEASGAVEHILSRGWLDIVGTVFNFPNGDSWLNTVSDLTPEIFRQTRRLDCNILMFKDYSANPQFGNLFERGEQSSKPSAAIEEWEGAKPEMQAVADKLFDAFQNGR